MHPRTRARVLAVRALARLESSERPLNATLEELAREGEPLAFAREVASGACRWRSRLDWTLAPLLKKPLEKLDPPVRAALRLALFERAVLQTPAPTAANEYAGLMREAGLKSAVGFVNAVARRLPSTWRPSPPREKGEARFLAIETSHSEWMVARWIERLGFEAASALCHANNEVAPLDLRLNTSRSSMVQVLLALRDRGINAYPTRLSPHNIRIGRQSRTTADEGDCEELADRTDQVLAGPESSSSSPWRWPEWEAGLLLAQDEAAQLVALCLGAEGGERILDVASAPGGKATHLAQVGGETCRVTAADRSTGRLKLVRENAVRLRLSNVEAFEGEARQVLEAVQNGELPLFDRVLLDAPCLGTGTLRRRPDAKWSKSPEQLEQLAGVQRELLDIAAACVRPGGALAYSTCSLEEEENSDAVRDFLARHPGWELRPPSDRLVEPETWRALAAAEDLPGAIATSPARDGCDGMFCAVLKRPREE